MDRDLLDTLLHLRDKGHEVTFVTLDPSSSSLSFNLYSDMDYIDDVVFVKRSELSSDLRHADILIDDEAEENMAQFDIEADEILDPENAAAILKSRFPDTAPGAPDLAPAPL